MVVLVNRREYVCFLLTDSLVIRDRLCIGHAEIVFRDRSHSKVVTPLPSWLWYTHQCVLNAGASAITTTTMMR